MRERPDAHEVPARWAAEVTGLCWFVPLEDVVEADIDVEITGEALIVRAHRSSPEPVVLIGLLLVPHGYDPEPAVIRFAEETLEVRIQRRPACDEEPLRDHWVCRARPRPRRSRRPIGP